jgi:hypothetical protein
MEEQMIHWYHHVSRCLFIVIPALMLLTAPIPAAPSSMAPDDEGGDVLKPGKKEKSTASSDFRVLLGFDAGLTYTVFKNGPAHFFLENPYISAGYANAHQTYFQHYLPVSVNEADGIGPYAGLALDMLFSKYVGITAKVNYHQRAGNFTQDVLSAVFAEGVITTLHDKTDWKFNYLGVDLLLRLALPLRDQYRGAGWNSIYLLAGPSVGFLLSNKAEVTQYVQAPNDIYYYQEINGELTIENQIRKASMNGEVTGFNNSRLDLKLGIGTEIALSERLSLTPEVTVTLPLNSFVKDEYTGPFTSHYVQPYLDFWQVAHDPFDPADANYHGTTPSLGYRYGLNSPDTNPDFNMSTLNFTVGLRWRIQ